MFGHTIDFGIDLGTTNSSIAVMHDGEAVIVKNELQKDTTPSCVYISRAGTSCVGEEALRRFKRNVARLRELFGSVALYIVTRSTKQVTMLSKPDSLRVSVPPALHECLRDTAKPYCCCCTDCKQECCEKGLGSTQVVATWRHPALDSVTIEYVYSPTLGGSSLYHRRIGSDKRTQVRWCADKVAARLR